MSLTKGEISSEIGAVSIDQMQRAINKEYVVTICTQHELNTVMTASGTSYWAAMIAPCALKLTEAIIRAEADGVGTSTLLGLYKAASGTAVGSGTRMAGASDDADFNTNGLTDATNGTMVLHTTAANLLVAAGDLVFIKIVTQGSEVLKSPVLRLTFERA